MIVRILGEGQLRLPDESADELNALDAALEAAVTSGDETAFRTALGELLAKVRSVATTLPAEALEDSDLILPSGDATLEEVQQMLGDEGLIPG